jgi:hypothetical protein
MLKGVDTSSNSSVQAPFYQVFSGPVFVQSLTRDPGCQKRAKKQMQGYPETLTSPPLTNEIGEPPFYI